MIELIVAGVLTCCVVYVGLWIWSGRRLPQWRVPKTGRWVEPPKTYWPLPTEPFDD